MRSASTSAAFRCASLENYPPIPILTKPASIKGISWGGIWGAISIPPQIASIPERFRVLKFSSIPPFLRNPRQSRRFHREEFRENFDSSGETAFNSADSIPTRTESGAGSDGIRTFTKGLHVILFFFVSIMPVDSIGVKPQDVVVRGRVHRNLRR